MLSYWNKYPNIKTELSATCAVIEKRIKTRNQKITEALKEMMRSGGKLIRPAFFFLFAQLGDRDKQDQAQLQKIAASIEMLHMASLIHDDIIDDSPLRRGTPSIQARFGKDIAVYAGDLLFTEFFELVAEVITEQRYLIANAQSMKRLLLGELDQMYSRFNPEENLAEYLQSVNGKTAELFILSCREGAHFGKASPDIEALAGEIGHNIGIAFQINDDILDYTASAQTLKKPTLEDLSQGVYTLPLLLAKNTAPADFAPYFQNRPLSGDEAGQVAQLVIRHGGVEQAKVYAEKFTGKAIENIRKLPGSLVKDQLLEITQAMLVRSY